MTGILRPALFLDDDEVEPFAFNLFQLDTVDRIIDLCSDAGLASDDRDDYADGRLVGRSYPPITVRHQVLLVHPDDDDRIVEEEVELLHVPGYAVSAMVRLIDRFADRIRFDEEAHTAARRVPQGAGPNRSDFLALDPAPGTPILEHERLREVVTELRAFLGKVRLAGFTLEL